MFVVQERPFNYSLCSLSKRDHSTTVYVRCPRETIQLPENEQSVVEWSLSDNEQTVVEWSLTKVNIDCSWIVSPTIQLQSMFVVRERLFNYSLCSLSVRDHSTTVYVRCPGETIQLQSMFTVRSWMASFGQRTDCSWMVSLGKRIECSWMVSLVQRTDCSWMVSHGQRTVRKRPFNYNLFVVRERPFNYNLFVFRERPLNYSLCSLSERDYSTTVYVRCPRESIQLQSKFVVSLGQQTDCSWMVSLGQRT
jgi:hypothetical protein